MNKRIYLVGLPGLDCSDRILPIRYYKPDIIVKNGSHFMVYANAEEISVYIAEHIKLQLQK